MGNFGSCSVNPWGLPVIADRHPGRTDIVFKAVVRLPRHYESVVSNLSFIIIVTVSSNIYNYVGLGNKLPSNNLLTEST